MRRLTLITVGLMLLLALIRSPALAADPQQIELAWSEISPLIEGQEIALVLPDATHLQGKVLAVRPDSLDLDVKKTANPRLHPKGQTSIPRSSVSLIELRKMRKFPIGAIAGGVAGVVGGTFLGALAGWGIAGDTGDFPVGAVLGSQVGAVAGGIVGGRVGHNLDRRNTLIKIIPEAPDSESLADPTQTGSEAMNADDCGLAACEAQTGVISEVVKAEMSP